MFLQGWKEVGKEGTQRRGREQWERTMCLFQKQFYSASHFWYSCYYWGREEKICSESVVFISFLSQTSCWQALPRSHFFSSKGLWEFSWMNKGLSAYVVRWTDCPPPPWRSPYSPLHLLRLSDTKGGAPPPPPASDCDAVAGGSLASGDCGSIATISQRFVEHHYCLCFLTGALPSEDSKGCKNKFK